MIYRDHNSIFEYNWQKIGTCSVGHGKYIYHHWLGICGTCFARNTISLRANVSTYTLGECILYVFAPYIALYLDCIRYVRYYVNSNLYRYSRTTYYIHYPGPWCCYDLAWLLARLLARNIAYIKVDIIS